MPDSPSTPPTYPNVDTLWHAVLCTILDEGQETGSRDGRTLEVLDRSFELTNTRYNVVRHPLRKLRPDYMGMELLWYLAGEDETEVPEFFAKHYRRFAQTTDNRDVMASDKPYCWGAYGARLQGRSSWRDGVSEWNTARQQRGFSGLGNRSQLEVAAQLLTEKPLSRQAMVQLWSPKDLLHSLAGGLKDVPCTGSIQFILRDGLLRMTVNMRSSDAWLGLPNDIFALTSMQQLVAMELNQQVGPATFHMASLHLYDRNLEAAITARANPLEEKPSDLLRCAVPSKYTDYHLRAAQLFDELRGAARAASRLEPIISPSILQIDPSRCGLLESCFACAMIRCVKSVVHQQTEAQELFQYIEEPLRSLYHADR